MKGTFWNKLLFLILLLAFGLVAFIVASGKIVLFKKSTAPTSFRSPGGESFVFTASGDFGGNANTKKVFEQLNPKFSKSAFHLALGDLSYDQITPESAWCAFVKGNLGEDFPFMLLAGNHEDNGPNGDIDEFVKCLPSKLQLGDMFNEYGKQYYFDFPQEDPIARFIMISPNLNFGNGVVSFEEEGALGWLEEVASEARYRGNWVIVGMHKPCISVGVKECESGWALTKALTSTADLVLMGHEHNYQRSKQLQQVTNCTRPEPYPGCLAAVEEGEDKMFAYGQGAIFLTSGTGGASAYRTFQSDPDATYFAKTAGGGSDLGNGFVRIELSKDKLTSEFIDVTGTFEDKFVIGRFTRAL